MKVFLSMDGNAVDLSLFRRLPAKQALAPVVLDMKQQNTEYNEAVDDEWSPEDRFQTKALCPAHIAHHYNTVSQIQ